MQPPLLYLAGSPDGELGQGRLMSGRLEVATHVDANLRAIPGVVEGKPEFAARRDTDLAIGDRPSRLGSGARRLIRKGDSRVRQEDAGNEEDAGQLEELAEHFDSPFFSAVRLPLPATLESP